MKKVIIGGAIVIVIVWGAWLAVPVSALQTLLQDAAGDYGVTLVFAGFEKGLFYRLHAEGITVRHDGRDIVELDAVDADIRPSHLVLSRVDLGFRGTVGEGSFSGDARLSRGKFRARMTFDRVTLADMTFLAMIGLEGTGTMSGRIEVDDDARRVDFSVPDADLQPVRLAGTLVPLNLFTTVKGSLGLHGNTIRVESVSLEGTHIFARLKGVIMGSTMDLQVEVMPDRDFLENPLFRSQIEKYQVSPGYYVIPIRGPLAS